MMSEPDGDEEPVRIAGEFFTDILPRIRDLGELKAALHVAHVGAVRSQRAVSLVHLLTPSVVRSVVGLESPEPAVDRLRKSLDRAIANGVLLRLTVRGPDSSEVYVLPATRENRNLVRRIGDDPRAAEALNLSPEFEATVYRPNIFSFYERHIGLLTPLVADQLREAERSYPLEWIESAILEAVKYNRRNWRYVESILCQWAEDGAPDRVSHPGP